MIRLLPSKWRPSGTRDATSVHCDGSNEADNPGPFSSSPRRIYHWHRQLVLIHSLPSQRCAESMNDQRDDRQPPTPPPQGLINCAEECQRQLESLKRYAESCKPSHFTSETKETLDGVINFSETCKVALRVWVASVSKGKETSDKEVIRTTTEHFEQLQRSIRTAEEALKARLSHRILHLNFHRSHKYVLKRTVAMGCDQALTHLKG